MSTLAVAYHGRIVLPLRSTSAYTNATLSSSPKWLHLPQSSIVDLRYMGIPNVAYFEGALSCRRDKGVLRTANHAR